MRRLIRRSNDLALGSAGLAISVHSALSVNSMGDYPGDAGPSLSALLQGNLPAFARAHPAMGAFSLLLRAPFAALAHLGNPTQLSIYRWGALPCVLSVALLALWLGALARRRGTSALGQWAILLIALLNPLIDNAIALGHPEELLTGALCAGALVAALESRAMLTAVLLGLAICSKQWAVVCILPILFTLERQRLRALLGSILLAALVTVPEVIGSPASFLANQISLAQNRTPSPSALSWWWPFAPNRTLHLGAAGSRFTFTGHRLPLSVIRSVHSVLVIVNVLVALALARARRLPLDLNSAFSLLSLVLLLRCTLDTETQPYYHAPLLLTLLAWDAMLGERLPLRALAGTGLAYLLFERLSPEMIGGPASVIYGICTAVVVLLLARTLHPTRRRARSAPRAGRPTAAAVG